MLIQELNEILQDQLHIFSHISEVFKYISQQ